MSHTQTKELNKVPLGSGTFYITEWDGSTIPENSVIEVDDNIIGRTKNGATVAYATESYTAVSDDGKARKTVIVSDSASIEYGMITWNAKTIEKMISTATVTETAGRRTAKIGGVENDDGKKYVVRFVHKDKIDGDIRITGVGRNSNGWNAVFSPNSETIITPHFECEPFDSDGHLLIYEEEIIEATS